MIYFENSRPDDLNYPTADPPETAFNPDGKEAIVRIGEYVVNRDGDIVIATTSNAGPWPNDFIASLNRGCFRAKYIGNRDDYLEIANQSRLASSEEAERAKHYKQSGFKMTEKGQLIMFADTEESN